MRSTLVFLFFATGCSATVVDGDGDGFIASEDCDDANNTVYPGAAEVCDGLDQNCDGVVDEGVGGTWYLDEDQDGFGDDSTALADCDGFGGYVSQGGDCNDADASIYPGAEEVCDEQDQDCDGVVDDGVTSTFYYDGDGDGFGNGDVRQEACEAPDRYVTSGDDCDDGDDNRYPGAPEVCDGRDQDCDGVIDNDVKTTWYADKDFDGYGDSDDTIEDCEQPDGYVSNADDCNDMSAGAYPGAPDLCNGEDDDCDGDIDEDSKAGWMLVSVDHQNETVWEVDPATADLSKIADMSIDKEAIPTMDVREDGLAVIYDSGNLALSEIDVCGGALTQIGSSGAGMTCGISFGPGGDLFGLDNTNDQLVRINTTTGKATVIGDLGFDLGACGLSYDCQTDTLVGADAKTDQIFTVDPGTGKASAFKSTGVPFTAVGLEFDPASGNFMGATGTALYEIDPTTGTSTKVGMFGSGGGSASLMSHINDLAFYPTCP